MSFKFKNIDALQRDTEIEGTTGTPLGLAGGITLNLLCASDANPRWKTGGEKFRAELRRLGRANASEDRVKKFLAEEFAKMFVIGWEGVLNADDDQPVPLTKESCVAFLLAADDAIPAIQEIVYDSKNFRGQRIEAIVEAGKS